MENTPKKEFNKNAKIINSRLKQIINDWEYLQDIYKDQLKKDPTSWRGIGNGSELEDIAILIEKLSIMVEILKWKDQSWSI